MRYPPGGNRAASTNFSMGGGGRSPPPHRSWTHGGDSFLIGYGPPPMLGSPGQWGTPALPATPHCLQHHITCNTKPPANPNHLHCRNDCQRVSKWLTGTGNVSIPLFFWCYKLLLLNKFFNSSSCPMSNTDNREYPLYVDLISAQK